MINPWSNYEYEFKMLMLTKNIEVWMYVDHSWLLPNTVDFQSSESLTEQTCDARLETWYEHCWRSMENHENNLRP